MDDQTTDPDLIDEAVILAPGELLVVRINPDRIRSRQELARLEAHVATRFKAMHGFPAPIVIVADQFAAQKPEDPQ